MTSTSVEANRTAAADRTPGDEAAIRLSEALRAGTRAAHEVAERSSFVDDLMAGRLVRADYAALAAQQHAIYTALEAAGDALRAAGRDGGLVLEELRRVPAIEADLAALLGAGWRGELVVLPATAAYAARIAEVGDDLPRYAAHAYTRYLGDLSGGQAIKRVLVREYGLTSGTAFYDFPLIERIKPFKDAYRARLDALALTPAQRRAAVEEARLAFRLNTAMFADLSAR
jgi:heme oxygenase